MLHSELTEKIIACAYTVYKKMGYGYLESVYERCMLIELADIGLNAEARKPMKVLYKGQIEQFTEFFDRITGWKTDDKKSRQQVKHL